MRVYVSVMAVVCFGFTLHKLRKGYRQRRTYWTRGSWFRFMAVCIGGLLVAFTPAGLEFAEAGGIYTPPKLSTDANSLWALGMAALMIVGALAFVLGIAWFANGDPTRAFPGFRWRKRAKA